MNRALPFALQLSMIYAAAAAGMSRISLVHNSDTIIQALVSLVHWTPYYWGENRFGMLVPLLAKPIADPAGNLIFQTVLIAWSGLMAVWLLHRLTEDPPVAAVATTISFGLLLLLAKPYAGFLVVLQSTYVTPLALLLAGWFVFTRKEWHLAVRLAGLAVALCLSFWINVSNVVFAGVLALLWPGLTWRERGAAVGIVAGTNLAATYLASLYPGQSFRELLPASQWYESVSRLLEDASKNFVHLPAVGVLLLAGAAMLAVRRKWDARVVLAIAAALQIAVVAMSEWVHRNGSDSRYIVPPLIVLCVLATATVAVPAGQAMRRLQSPVLGFGLASLMVVAIATRAFGFPSPAGAYGFLEQATRPKAESFGTVACTHLLGDYWTTWMAMYHDMLTGRRPVRHAVTFRSDVTRAQWDTPYVGERTYCAACADTTLEYFRLLEKVPPLTLTGNSGPGCQWTQR